MIVAKESLPYFFLIFRTKPKIIKLTLSEKTNLRNAIKQVLNELGYKDDVEEIIKFKRKSGPEILDIAITGRCNLDCKHCYWGQDKFEYKDIKFNTLKKVIEESFKLGVFHVILTGGEPLLYKKFTKLLKLLYFYRFRISIVTNGILLEKFIDKFKKYGIYEITVSLDGFKEEYEEIRNYEWEKVVENIKKLKENRINVRVNAILSKKLSQHWKDFYKFCKEELKVDKVVFLPIAIKGNAKLHKEISTPYSILQKIICEMGYTDKPWCYPFYRRIAIGFDGFIYPCQFFREIDCVRLGNIFNESLIKIYSRIKENVSFPFYKTVKCEKCKFFNKCGGGCRGRAMSYFNTFEEKDPFWCEIIKKGDSQKDMLPEMRNPLYTVFSKHYSKYYEKPSWIYEVAGKWTEEISPQNILEIGGGDGTFTKRIKEKMKNVEITFVDNSKDIIKLAKTKLKNLKNVEIICKDVQTFIEENSKHFESKYFDVTIMLYSFLFHLKKLKQIENVMKSLANISRYLIFDIVFMPPNTFSKQSFKMKEVEIKNFSFNDGKYCYSFSNIYKNKKEYFYACSFPLIKYRDFLNLIKNAGLKIKKFYKKQKRFLFMVSKF